MDEPLHGDCAPESVSSLSLGGILYPSILHEGYLTASPAGFE